jgi:hypothetical protein
MISSAPVTGSCTSVRAGRLLCFHDIVERPDGIRQLVQEMFSGFRAKWFKTGSGIRFFDFTLELAAYPASRLENRRIEVLTQILSFVLG